MMAIIALPAFDDGLVVEQLLGWQLLTFYVRSRERGSCATFVLWTCQAGHDPVFEHWSPQFGEHHQADSAEFLN